MKKKRPKHRVRCWHRLGPCPEPLTVRRIETAEMRGLPVRSHDEPTISAHQATRPDSTLGRRKSLVKCGGCYSAAGVLSGVSGDAGGDRERAQPWPFGFPAAAVVIAAGTLAEVRVYRGSPSWVGAPGGVVHVSMPDS